METDRYEKNHPLYIFGMICFLISMGVLLFSLYMLPYLMFGVLYDVPEFIAFWREYLVSDLGMTDNHALMLIYLSFTFCWLLFGLGAYYASIRIENAIYAINDTKKPGGMHLSPETKESLYVFWKVMALIAFFYGVIFVFHWLLSAPFTFP